MNCKACKAQILPGRKFCTKCGAAVTEAPPAVVCAACGGINAVDARFCGDCGIGTSDVQAARAPPGLTRQAPDAERRQLTVQFCDLVGSTELSTRLDPEDLRDVIGAYHRRVAEIVARFGGYVAQYLGDGVLAYYGYPQAHEDDAERAVRAALALIDTVSQIEAPERLRVRVGIATGLVVVGDLVSASDTKEARGIGETPNLAARLQALANPGEVVIAESTRRLTGGLFDYHSLGTIQLKGFAAPIVAWQVLREGATTSRFEAFRSTAPPTALVGREAEIDLLVEHWQRAKQGAGQVVLLSAEPGIGKSRLAAALEQERLRGRPPYTRLRYFCSPHHTDSALYPIVAQLERAAGLRRDDTPEGKLDKLEVLLAETSPPPEDVALLAELLEIPGSNRYPPPNFTPQRKRERTLEALVGQFVALARRQPLLMVFEDAHWIDPTSRDLLDIIVAQIANLPMMLLITFRPEFEPSSWTGRPHVTLLELRRLDQHDTAAIVAQVVRNKPLPAEIMDQIVAKTDGVPLFVEELTKMILESGFLEDRGDRYELAGPLAALAIPDSLQGSLMARLDRLGRVKELAQVGAAIGQAFTFGLLAAVAPVPGIEVQKGLDRLVDTGLVLRRESDQQTSYAFKHALVQDAAYQSLLRSTRQQMHARIAGVLEERFPETVETEPEFLAHHCTQASLIDKAANYRLKAGMRAIERSGAMEAVSHLEKGLELMPRLAPGGARDGQELGLQVALAAVIVGSRGYPATETVKVIVRARELCERTGDRPRTLAVLFLQNAVHITRGEFEAVRETGEELRRRGQEWGDTGAELMGLHQLAAALHGVGELDQARTQFEQVLALYDPERHRPLTFLYAQNPQISGLSYLSCILFVLGYPEQARRRSEEALAGARELLHFNTTAFALIFAAILEQLCRDAPAARARSEELVMLSTEQRLFHWLAGGQMIHGWCLAESGEGDAGSTEFNQGEVTWRAINAGYFLPYILAVRVDTQRHTGLPAQAALDVLGEALSVVSRTGERWYEAELHRLRGEYLLLLPITDEPRAEESFLQALKLARAQRAKMWELRAATSLATLWRSQSKQARARDLLAPVYASFTEGFDTPDLRQAAGVLDTVKP